MQLFSVPVSPFVMQNFSILQTQFKVQEVLGSGGFGKVWRCVDVETNKEYAIKKMRIDEPDEL